MDTEAKENVNNVAEKLNFNPEANDTQEKQPVLEKKEDPDKYHDDHSA